METTTRITMLLLSSLFLVACHKEPEPKEAWAKGRGVVSKLELFDGGEYRWELHCDVCEEKVETGRWNPRDGKIILSLQDGTDRIFLRKKYRGCDALLSEDQVAQREAILPSDVYFRDGDACANAL